MKFQYWKSNGLWYFHLKAGNREIIANGEGYKNKADMLIAIALVKESGNAPVMKIAVPKK